MPDGAVARHGPCVANSDRKRLYSAYATRRGGARLKLGLVIPHFTWPGGPPRLGADLAAVAQAADAAGFEWIGVMDHLFQIPAFGPPELDMLEAYTTLGYLAAHTARAQLLTIAPAAIYRHPGVGAKIVTTLDVLSGGGPGWASAPPGTSEEALWLGSTLPAGRHALRATGGDGADLPADVARGRGTLRGQALPAGARPERAAEPERPHPPILIAGNGERKTCAWWRATPRPATVKPTQEMPQKLEGLRATARRRPGLRGDPENGPVQFDVGPNGEASAR